VPYRGVRKLSPERVAELRELYAEHGTKLDVLAERFGVSRITIRAVLEAKTPYDQDGPALRTPVSRHGGATRISPEQVSAIRAEHARGTRVQSIAEAYGVHMSTAYAIVRGYGRFAQETPGVSLEVGRLKAIAAIVDEMIEEGRSALEITKYVLDNATKP
jgi:transposase